MIRYITKAIGGGVRVQYTRKNFLTLSPPWGVPKTPPCHPGF